jgi:hypothetical protein
MRYLLSLLIAATAATPSFAISTYLADIPNAGTFRCLLCHTRSGGGEGWNDFGQDILIAGGANPSANPNNQNLGFTGRPADYWLDICGDDSDGDGHTNGEELGDPDCVWTRGDPNPDVEPSNPGNPDSVPDDPGDPEAPLPTDDDVVGCGAVGATATGFAVPLLFLALLAPRGPRRRSARSGSRCSS